MTARTTNSRSTSSPRVVTSSTPSDENDETSRTNLPLSQQPSSTARTTINHNTMIDRDERDYVQNKKTKKPKKSVSFYGVVTVHHVSNIDGYTFDEIDDMWWSKDEYREMQRDIVAIAQSVRTQNTKNLPLALFELCDRMELRGLEGLIEREQMWEKIDASLETVLSHFRDCNDEKNSDDEEGTVVTDDNTSYDSSEFSATAGAAAFGCETSQQQPSWLTSYSMYSEVAIREARINGLIDELSAIKVMSGDKESCPIEKVVTKTSTEEDTTVTVETNVEDDTDDASNEARNAPTTTTTTTVESSEVPVHANDTTGCDGDENDLTNNNAKTNPKIRHAGRLNRNIMNIPKLSWMKKLRGNGHEEKPASAVPA